LVEKYNVRLSCESSGCKSFIGELTGAPTFCGGDQDS